MILNGIEISELRGDNKIYQTPKLKANEKIKLLYDDTSTKIPGCKKMKKGNYIIKKIRNTYFGKGQVYEIFSDRINAKYEFPINTIAIDKAIELNLIEIIK